MNGFKQPIIKKPIFESGIHDYHGVEEIATLTVYSTLDSYTTVTNKHYNTVPLTITEFSKSTVTVPTKEVSIAIFSLNIYNSLKFCHQLNKMFKLKFNYEFKTITSKVVPTQVDDIVRVSTVQITRTGTETVTDIFSMHKCATETSTEFVTVTHLNQNVLQTTVTRTTVST